MGPISVTCLKMVPSRALDCATVSTPSPWASKNKQMGTDVTEHAGVPVLVCVHVVL